MPILVASILGGLIQAAGTLVGRVLVSLGIGYVAFSGVDASITWARDFALAQFAWLPSTAVGIAGTLNVGVCISILSSAVAARLVLMGLQSGTLKRMVQR